MSKHRKQWSIAEKLEILNHLKTWGIVKTSREYGISTTSVYKWKNLFESSGEEGLSSVGNEKADRQAILDLERENARLKKLVADKELRLMIQEELLKKSPSQNKSE